MKRLLALLIAVLLPACASAETYGISVSVGLNEEVFAAYAVRALQTQMDDMQGQNDAIITAAVRILNGFGISAAFQEDAAALQIKLAGSDFLDIVYHQAEEAGYLSSSLLSGYALKAEQSPEQVIQQPIAQPWQEIASAMQEAFCHWAGSIPMADTTGVFSGDAYEGGTHCKTWMLTDRDIAALMSSLATGEVRAALRNLLNDMGVETTASLLSGFDSMNDRVAKENRFSYMLRVVTDDNDAFVGASLTVFDGQLQVATCSLGTADQAIRLVTGLGLSEQNYWWEFTVRQSRQENITYLNGNCHEWTAPKTESFSYVSKTNAPLTSYMLRAALTQSGSRYLWDGTISQGDETASTALCSSKGSISPDEGVLACKISLGDSNSGPIWLNISAGHATEIAPFDASQKICSMTAPADAALLQELTEKCSATLLARLIKLLPMDLIMTMNPLTLP